MPTPPLICNQRGIALLYLVILFTLVGVLVAAGVRQFGSMVNQAKSKDSKAELERDVQMITAWAVKNGHLPNKDSEFVGDTGVFKSNTQDAWGRSEVYVYDNNLSASTTGGLCGRTSTVLSYSSGQDVANVAFLLLSSGENSSLQSTMAMTGTGTGTLNDNPLPIPPASIVSGQIKVTGGTGSVKAGGANDIIRYVTLAELKAQAGCDGPTQGSLKILNNELPTACAGRAVYPANLFANGGVPAYSWSLPPLSLPPSWLLVDSTTGVLNPNPRITITPGSYNVTAQLADSTSTTPVQRTYSIKVSILGSCSAICFADTDCLNLFVANSACLNSCFADPACSTACAANTTCSSVCAANQACRDACTANPACTAACPACITP